MHDPSSYEPAGQDDKQGMVLHLRVTEDRMYAVRSDHSVSVFKWNTIPDDKGNPFMFSSGSVTKLRADNLSILSHSVRKQDMER